MMNLSQTKLVGLTMELDLKAREYNELCDKLEQVKQSNIKPEDERLLELKKLFQKNHDEIIEINKKIKELEEYTEKQKLEKYDTTNLFKTKNIDSSKSKEGENLNISVIKTKKSIFEILIKKIKKFFSRDKK